MSATLDTSVDGCWTLAGDLDFDSVCALVAQSRVAWKDRPAVSVDLGQVGRSNSAGLALLLEWMRWSVESGDAIVFRQLPDSLRRLATISGLELPEAGDAGRISS